MNHNLLTTLCATGLTLVFLAILPFQGGCKKSAEGPRPTVTGSAAGKEEALRYYATHSPMTDPGPHVDLYEGLAPDPKRLVAAAQGVLVHGALTWLYGLQPRDEQNEGWKIRRVQDMLERIRRLDGRPLTGVREPQNLLVVNCRQFAVLTCSMFRHHGIPSRARGGYATYTWRRGKYENHWICEYWSSAEHRWVQVDAQIDQKQRELMKIDFNTLDMPRGKFVPAGTGWKLCRGGQVQPKLFGLGGKEGWQGLGWDMVRPDVVCDLMALNKLELLPWDVNPVWKRPQDEHDQQALALLDKIAEMTESPDEHFSSMRALYESDPRLTMPPDWKP